MSDERERRKQAWEELQKQKSKEESEIAKHFPRYPVDEDGFAVSFDPNEPDKYLPLLQSHGVVVIRVMSREQCERTVEAMFDDLNRQQSSTAATHRLHPDKPETWETVNWPAAALLDRGEKGTKFLVSTPTLCRTAFENRVSDPVYTAFQHIYQSEDIVCSLDVWGIARGTSGLQRSAPLSWSIDATTTQSVAASGDPDEDEEPSTPSGHDHDEPEEEEWREERPEWRWGLPLHWHVNPWKHHITHADAQPTYMSLVALVDCNKDVGSHLTVPGSTAFLAQWAQDPENAALEPAGRLKATVYLPKWDRMKAYAQELCLRAGDLVVWDRRQAHGSFPNHGPRPRLYQFIRYLPRSDAARRSDFLYPDRVYDKYNAVLSPAALAAAATPATPPKAEAELWALLRSLGNEGGLAAEGELTLQGLIAAQHRELLGRHQGRGWRVLSLDSRAAAPAAPPPEATPPGAEGGYLLVRPAAQARGEGGEAAGGALLSVMKVMGAGGAGLAAAECEVEGGASVPWYTREGEHEAWVVVSGRLEVGVGSEEAVAEAGALLLAAPGVRRRYRALGPARVLCVRIPAGSGAGGGGAAGQALPQMLSLQGALSPEERERYAVELGVHFGEGAAGVAP